MRVEPEEDGTWRVMRGDEVVASGLTNSQAWRMADVAGNEHLSKAEATSDWVAGQIIGSEPKAKKPRQKKPSKRALKAAKHLPPALQDVAFTKSRGSWKRAGGTFGPASPVRHIDPSEYKGDK